MESSGNTRKRQLRHRLGGAVQMLCVKGSVRRSRRRMPRLSLRTNSSAIHRPYVVTERRASRALTWTSISSNFPTPATSSGGSDQNEAETGAARR
jgi:hypothetical protein